MKVVINPRELKLRELGNGSFELTQEFRVHVRGRNIVVPLGFKTDLASIPKFMQRFISKQGKNKPAAVVHDYLYAIGKGSRKEADVIFLILMRALGVWWWRRKGMYRAVRIFGGVFWNGD